MSDDSEDNFMVIDNFESGVILLLDIYVKVMIKYPSEGKWPESVTNLEITQMFLKSNGKSKVKNPSKI